MNILTSVINNEMHFARDRNSFNPYIVLIFHTKQTNKYSKFNHFD
jgi:hypothetical protein